jgi:oligopeptide transport system substrate-binding protein
MSRSSSAPDSVRERFFAGTFNSAEETDVIGGTGTPHPIPSPSEGRGKFRALLSILLILVLSALFLFCGGCALEKPADLRIINGKEPESLDPGTVVGQADGRVVQSVFEGLTRYNATNGEPEPAISDHWTISPDGKRYTFHIRTNAMWSTGERITAHDVAYSWFRVLDPKTAGDYVGNLFYIRGAEDFNLGKDKDPSDVGIKALDEETLQVDLVNPTAFFLDLCAFPTQAVVPQKTIEKYGENWLKARPLPVSGAYQLESWRLDDRIRLRKNPFYWDAHPNQIELIDLLPVNSPNSALNLYVKGEVDIIWDKEVVPSDLLDILTNRNDFHRFDYLGTYFYRYNVTRKPLNDPRVRKALALVVDRTKIVTFVTRGGERPADFYVPPGLPHYTSPPGLGYDPERGRKLLAEAGFPGGRGFPRMEYLFNTSRENEKIALQLQDMWQRELGIHIELRSVEWKVYLNSQTALDYDICRSSWIGDYTDPNTFLDMYMSSNPNNRTGWKSDRYDTLMRTANATADLKARAKILQQAESILIRDELPIVPLYIYVGFNFFDPSKIQGIFDETNIRDEHPLRAIRKVRR